MLIKVRALTWPGALLTKVRALYWPGGTAISRATAHFMYKQTTCGNLPRA